jgi:hypothetical protein
LTAQHHTGGNEVVIDPNNPEVLYASTWQRRRGVGQMIGGGPESGIYKSTNGGATWTELTKGLPQGDMGRIAMGVDPKAKPTRVYALINALADTGFYRRMMPACHGARGPPARRAAAAPAPDPPRPAPAPGGGGRGGGIPGVYHGGDPGYELYVDRFVRTRSGRQTPTSSGAATAARRSPPSRTCRVSTSTITRSGSTRRTATTSSSATTAGCTNRGMKGRPGGTSRTCR